MMKRNEERGTTASLGRGTKKRRLKSRYGFFACRCRFVHRPSEAVVPRPSVSSGFTLVEILATFVLIAIILPVAMNGISIAAKLANQAKRRVEAGTIAEKLLNDLVLTGDYEDGDQTGEASGENTEYDWSFEVNDWEEEDSMQELDMTVSWEDAGGREKSVTLSTLVYSGSDE